jgi:hypothetical protein
MLGRLFEPLRYRRKPATTDNLADPDVLAQEIVVPRLASLGTTPSQANGPAVDRVEGSKTSKPSSNNSAKPERT